MCKEPLCYECGVFHLEEMFTKNTADKDNSEYTSGQLRLYHAESSNDYSSGQLRRNRAMIILRAR